MKDRTMEGRTIGADTQRKNMTLREIKTLISATDREKKTPTAKALRETGTVIDTYQKGDFLMAVYSSGFATIVSGKRKAVVAVDKKNSYHYDLDDIFLDQRFLKEEKTATPHDFNEDFFLDEPWPLWVMLIGEDQLEENQNNRERKWISKKPEITENLYPVFGSEPSAEKAAVTKIWREELLKELTEKQREAFLLYYDYGFTQEEIGMLLGISRETVKSRLKGIKKKIEKNTR